jgi:hypothetical protein
MVGILDITKFRAILGTQEGFIFNVRVYARSHSTIMTDLFGFDANNKIFISTQPQIAQGSIY